MQLNGIRSKSLKEVLVLLGNGDGRPPRGTHLFEVCCVVGVLDGGPPGHPRVPDVGPVELLEPLVLLDVVAVVAGAEPALGVGVEEAEDEVLGAQGEEVGELDDPLEDLLVDVAGLVVVVERRVTGQQLVDEDADAPVVDLLAVAALVGLLEHLGGEVLGGPADSESPGVVESLGKAEVDELGEAVGVTIMFSGLRSLKTMSLVWRWQMASRTPAT